MGLEATAPAYLPMAGNDLSFATPSRLDGDPVLAPLAIRCSACHGPGPGVGTLITFAMIVAHERTMPRVDRLVTAQNAHARDVAKQKMEREDFKALFRYFPAGRVM